MSDSKIYFRWSTYRLLIIIHKSYDEKKGKQTGNANKKKKNSKRLPTCRNGMIDTEISYNGK